MTSRGHRPHRLVGNASTPANTEAISSRLTLPLLSLAQGT